MEKTMKTFARKWSEHYWVRFRIWLVTLIVGCFSWDVEDFIFSHDFYSVITRTRSAIYECDFIKAEELINYMDYNSGHRTAAILYELRRELNEKKK